MFSLFEIIFKLNNVLEDKNNYRLYYKGTNFHLLLIVEFFTGCSQQNLYLLRIQIRLYFIIVGTDIQ